MIEPTDVNSSYSCTKYWAIDLDTPNGLTLEKKLLPEYLKDLGYSTHLIGK